MNIKGLAATAAITAGMVVGLSATAQAQPAGDDFWQCAADHQDTDGIGVCCVFYGGDYDERTGECWIDDEAKLEEANPGPSVPPKHAVLTRVDRLPSASVDISHG
jgi:nitrite reductase/ring-hydroxylating ferredoxin subunit